MPPEHRREALGPVILLVRELGDNVLLALGQAAANIK